MDSVAFLVLAESKVDQNLTCVSTKLPCASLGQGCERPETAFVLKVRGVGGKMLGEGCVLAHHQ